MGEEGETGTGNQEMDQSRQARMIAACFQASTFLSCEGKADRGAVYPRRPFQQPNRRHEVRELTTSFSMPAHDQCGVSETESVTVRSSGRRWGGVVLPEQDKREGTPASIPLV